MYRRKTRDEDGFVWQPKTNWRKQIIRLVVVGGAMGIFVWSTLLPISTVTTRRAETPEPALKQSTENSAPRTISRQTQLRFEERLDVVETSRAMGEARRPAPWVIRAQ